MHGLAIKNKNKTFCNEMWAIQGSGLGMKSIMKSPWALNVKQLWKIHLLGYLFPLDTKNTVSLT